MKEYPMISFEAMSIIDECEHLPVLNHIHELVCEKCGIVLEENEFKICNMDNKFDVNIGSAPSILNKSTKMFYNRHHAFNRRLYHIERRHDRLDYDKFITLLGTNFNPELIRKYTVQSRYLSTWEKKFVWVYGLLHRELHISLLQYKELCDQHNIKFKLALLYGKYTEQIPLITVIRQCLQTLMDKYSFKVVDSEKVCKIVEICYNAIKLKKHINHPDYCIYAILIKLIPFFKSCKEIGIAIGNEKFKTTSITNYFSVCTLIDSKIKLAKDAFKSLIIK
jgi:hypothetical protein